MKKKKKELIVIVPVWKLKPITTYKPNKEIVPRTEISLNFSEIQDVCQNF